MKTPFQKFSNSQFFEMHNLYIKWLYVLRFVTCNLKKSLFSVHLMNEKCINCVNLWLFECQSTCYEKAVKASQTWHQYLRLRLKKKRRLVLIHSLRKCKKKQLLTAMLRTNLSRFDSRLISLCFFLFSSLLEPSLSMSEPFEELPVRIY